MKNTKTRAIGAVAVVVLGTLALLGLTKLVGQQHKEQLGLYVAYQALALIVAGVVVVLIAAIKGRKLGYLRFGKLAARTSPVPFLGVEKTDSWKSVGLTFAVIISVVTGIFLYLAYKAEIPSIAVSSWLLAFVIALPLSASNALAEEVVTRWAVVEGLAGGYQRYAPWVSAVIFGAVHYFGIPGGGVGALMAGFLGWILAKTIQDTKGIGWAWIIHFLQDVLIFTITIAVFI